MIRLVVATCLLAACSSPDAPGEGPRLAVVAGDRDRILARLDQEPFRLLHDRLLARASSPWRDRTDPAIWDYPVEIENAGTVQAAAFLAWLHQDPALAERARDLLARMPVDINSDSSWDLNIRLPEVTMGYTDAWDLLAATPWFPDNEAAAARARIETLTGAIYDRYVVDSVNRYIALGLSQNNHPIRTAVAIGYPALRFGDGPHAGEWLDWAVSELDYLWGPDGRYVQGDGGVSEGPAYYMFGFAPSVAFFIAADHALDPDRWFLRDCRNRSAEDPWLVVDCVDGEPFRFANPIRIDRFWSTAAWSTALRLPDGQRPPLEDARITPPSGQALLTAYGAPDYLRWDWEHVAGHERLTDREAELTLHHLALLEPRPPSAPPPWRNRFLPVSGQAVLRSGWDADAVWLLATAEHGAARKTLHDHVDGTSFTLAAYGEYLLIDSGYYKPFNDNAVTAHASSHNVILIDGGGAPDKGLLTFWGDADAFLENFGESAQVGYVEARQQYRDTDIRRSFALVRGRYAVVADRLESSREAREHRWRLHGHAGFESGGVFRVLPDGGDWQRGAAGVRQHLASSAGPVRFEEPPFVPLQAPHVDELHGEYEPGHHAVLDGIIHATDPDFLAVLAPYRVGATPGAAELTVDAVAVGPERAAWLVTSPSGRDLVLLRSPTSSSEVVIGEPPRTVRTDAELAVVGLDDGLVAIARGTYVDLDGRRVATAAAQDGAAVFDPTPVGTGAPIGDSPGQ